VFVMMCSMSVPICNHFHTKQDNSDKIMFCKEYPSLMPSFKRNPLTKGHKILSQKTRDLVATKDENSVTLACTILLGLKGVTNR